MPENDPSTAERGRLTRRGVLALAGTTALAGCAGLSELGGEPEPTIRAYDLRDIDPGEDPDPIVPESVPVDIAPSYIDATRERITALLDELPTPFGPEEIPNGYVRQQLVAAAANATTGLNEARDASTEFAALMALQRARAEARYAAAGWAVAEEGRSVDALRGEHERVISDAQSTWEAHEYVGSDLIRAALVHSRIEGLLDQVVDDRAPRRRESRLLTVAEWGETTESARAYLDDARHLDEQFTASLPDNVGTVEGTLTEAAETLFDELRSRVSTVPPEPTADEWGIPERAISELRRDATYGVTRMADATGPASAVVDVNRQLTRIAALDDLQTRIDHDAVPDPESAEAVREVRAAAYDALNAALRESSVPGLTRTAITGVAWRVANADWELSRYEGEFPASRLDSNVADYLVATAVAEAAPAVAERTAEAL